MPPPLCYPPSMSHPDLNLLVTLDVLLAEGSVARLSPSAMSRALARLRETTGDPLLVRAGRGLVPTPHALELRERVGRLVQDAEAVLRPAERLDLKKLVRTFTLRSSDGFVENFGPGLIALAGEQAPGVQLRFIAKPDKDSGPLRDGTVDLETGVAGEATGPEVRVQSLFRDRFVGVVRIGHPLDEAIEGLGFRREIATIVGGFSAALALARGSDLVATVPERHTRNLRKGLFSFPLPVPMPEITVSLLWHPRMDADPAHRWLRGCVRDVCAASAQEERAEA